MDDMGVLLVRQKTYGGLKMLPVGLGRKTSVAASSFGSLGLFKPFEARDLHVKLQKNLNFKESDTLPCKYVQRLCQNWIISFRAKCIATELRCCFIVDIFTVRMGKAEIKQNQGDPVIASVMDQ